MFSQFSLRLKKFRARPSKINNFFSFSSSPFLSFIKQLEAENNIVRKQHSFTPKVFSESREQSQSSNKNPFIIKIRRGWNNNNNNKEPFPSMKRTHYEIQGKNLPNLPNTPHPSVDHHPKKQLSWKWEESMPLTKPNKLKKETTKKTPNFETIKRKRRRKMPTCRSKAGARKQKKKQNGATTETGNGSADEWQTKPHFVAADCVDCLVRYSKICSRLEAGREEKERSL